MTIRIQAMTAKPARVLRVFEGDSMAIELGRFEYGYQADIFAKAISRESDGVLAVVTCGRHYADSAFERGRIHKGFVSDVKFEEESRL